ncbi:hypothetical protein [Arcanobacterium bovis]|uniref:Uncharacterized protein n=1 Tax=Arcanobacterium bovis TaxID=2529275 RepID=A0A4Q9UZE3_9ACTO|nr:hypothetical protein [Arcanobacterium bovis]TBW21389.1 hypothetical protein EZJ44_05400 [Arcanobacterium bovis]
MCTNKVPLSDFTPADLLPIISASAFIITSASIGLAFGLHHASDYLGPIIAVVVFGIYIALYGSTLRILVQTGGATGTLVGYEPNILYHLLQIGCHICIIFVASAFAIPNRAKVTVTFRMLSCVLFLLIIVLSHQTELKYSRNNIDFRLASSLPSITCKSTENLHVCVGIGYKEFLNKSAQRLQSTYTQLHNEFPTIAWSTDWAQDGAGQESSPFGVFHDDEGLANNAQDFMNALVSPQCDFNKIQQYWTDAYQYFYELEQKAMKDTDRNRSISHEVAEHALIEISRCSSRP